MGDLEPKTMNANAATTGGSITLPRKDLQTSAVNLAFDNGASKSNSLTVVCGQKRNASKKCYHARTDPIGDPFGRWGQSSHGNI